MNCVTACLSLHFCICKAEISEASRIGMKRDMHVDGSLRWKLDASEGTALDAERCPTNTSHVAGHMNNSPRAAESLLL